MSDAAWALVIEWLRKHKAQLVVPNRGAVHLASAPRNPPRGREWVSEPYPDGRFL